MAEADCEGDRMDSGHAATGAEPEPRFSAEQLTDWLTIFDAAPTPDADGALTKKEIMRAKGWTDWTAGKRIDEKLEAGALEWVRVQRFYKGQSVVVTAYRPRQRTMDER